MRLSFRDWRKLWAWFKALRESTRFSLRRDTWRTIGRRRRSPGKPKRRARLLRPSARHLLFEGCEPRQMLATDLAIGNFAASNLQWAVSYSVTTEAATPFTATVYRSSDGVTLDQALTSTTVNSASDLSVGSH